MNIRIVVDSSANILNMEEANIASVPLTLRTDEKEFVDDAQLNIEEMTEYLGGYKGKSGSACPSTGSFLEAFGDAEQLIVITISSNLSGSYNAARIAKDQYEDEYPNRKVCLIDSLSAGPELRLLIEKIQELEQTDITFEELCQKVTEYQKRTHISFCLKSLTNLANNGRVNPAVAKLAGILNIRMIGIGSEEGTIAPKDKARGDKKAFHALYKVFEEFKYNGGKVRIDHCLNMEDAEKFKELILSKFPSADVRIAECRGLCSFYAERGGLIAAFES